MGEQKGGEVQPSKLFERDIGLSKLFTGLLRRISASGACDAEVFALDRGRRWH